MHAPSNTHLEFEVIDIKDGKYDFETSPRLGH
jgi:hypothetical protein